VCNAQTGGVFKPAKEIIERLAGDDGNEEMKFKKSDDSDAESNSD
jgi:hypothetical protein